MTNNHLKALLGVVFHFLYCQKEKEPEEQIEEQIEDKYEIKDPF
ncbi:MAG: hypothetical protein O3B46_06405 [Bacteroidetes bacterium]|nr:hypothetical protein [Bacteroidota bacterium]MDA0922761.1 hypothetical protein [Bacteroidota bacterium]MDA1289051.1 hypothetical protein [Bacteroidota bacterium]